MATRARNHPREAALETARLRLERWDDTHFERFSRFMRDPRVIRYIRPLPLDAVQAREQHEHSMKEWDVHGFGKRAIIEASTGRWLGFAELSPVGPGKGSRDDDVELGYFIEPTRWGAGLATEAAIAVRDDAFGRCGLSELIGRCRVENAASARVLAKVGFERLRLFQLADRVVVEIHHLRRGRRIPERGLQLVTGAVPVRGAPYRETG